MDQPKNTELEKLWNLVEEINLKNFGDNGLCPIFGNGKTEQPEFMFIFINPTHVNISSRKEWNGPRYPFIGTKAIWRIFDRAGLFDSKLMSTIEKTREWPVELAYKVLKHLDRKSFYFTNIVKWTGEDATLPDSRKTTLFLPILKKEIEIVRPKNIVTFGLIPFQKLVGEKIKLKEYYQKTIVKQFATPFEYKIDNNVKTRVFPCYFPIGRGEPKKAVEMLKIIRGS